MECHASYVEFGTTRYDGNIDCVLLSDFILWIVSVDKTLGNHEFDHGVSNLASFINSTDWPVICANIKAGDEPEIDGKIIASLLRVFRVNCQQVLVGFIGALYDKTNVSF